MKFVKIFLVTVVVIITSGCSITLEPCRPYPRNPYPCPRPKRKKITKREIERKTPGYGGYCNCCPGGIHRQRPCKKRPHHINHYNKRKQKVDLKFKLKPRYEEEKGCKKKRYKQLEFNFKRNKTN